MKKRTSIYISKPIAAALESANSISGRIGNICDRYLEIVKQARITQIFTTEELSEIIECCKGVTFSPARVIDIDIINSFAEFIEMHDRPSNGDAVLADKLRVLTYAEHVALAELIEWHWGVL